MEGCHAAMHYERISLALDEFMLYDGVDMTNSAGVEILCRWCYGYRKATALVTKPEHWKGSKQQLKTRWDLLDRYDPLFFAKQGPSISAADAKVTDQLKTESLFNKYYTSSQTNVANPASVNG